MSLHLRLRVDTACCVHRRYNPERDGRPENCKCPGCESLYCVWLYAQIARKKAEEGEGLARHTQRKAAQRIDASHPQVAPHATAPLDGAHGIDDEREAQ